ncbi:MAG: ATP-binding protein, partial [Candidatus Scalindua sp.]
KFDIPVIYLTAHGEEVIFERAKKTEPFGYIIKPFKNEELQKVIEIGLYRHGAEEERRKLIQKLKNEIAERKRAEVQIRKLSRVVEQSPNIVVMTDTKGNIEYVNPKFTQITGYSIEEAIGKNPRVLKSGKTSLEVYKELWKAITSGKEWRGEFCNRKKNGELFWESASISPVKGDKGVITHFIAVKEDITERREIEKELIKAQKLESVGILAGGIAHDFNNNLQAISGYITMAKMHTNPNDEIREHLEDAGKVILESKGLSQQLLTFSKGGEPVKNAIFISKLIRDSAKLALSGSNLMCDYDIPDDLWLVEADKGQMKQVISNLIINADQAMPAGGIIRVKAKNTNVAEKNLLPVEEGNYVKITIEDQGTGISQKHLQKIFDPFFTTKQKGSGLGLSTSYSIIKKHNGHITVESQVGVGTTFHIYLPVSRIETQKKPVLNEVERSDVEPIEEEDKEEKITSSKGRVLIMDDEDLIRFVTGEHMRRLKYEVETAKDGSEVLELYKSASESGNPFDAVIMDLTIPGGMGGKEAIERLYEIDPEVRAIVVSGYANDPIMANYKKYGFCGVLAKPYEIHELDETLQKVIMEKLESRTH